MTRKQKKRPPTKQPGTMRWEFDADVPTHDFFEFGPLDDMGNLQEAVECFVYRLEEDLFLTWEAVVCEEQGIPLTPRQKEALGDLLNFNADQDDDGIFYIDETARPSEPWYVILNKIVPHLLMEPYRTFDVKSEVQSEGWMQILTALDEHGQDLSLPAGVASYREVVAADLRHKLWLQYCFEVLDGLGQDDDLYLEEDDPWRVDELIDCLRQYKDSVAYFGLTLDSMLTRVILPERDRPLFVKLMRAKLGLKTGQEQIAPCL